MSALTRATLPERQRNYRFALTPLADAMFQLLIFFMLSTGLTPYSLLTLQSGQAAAQAPTGTGGDSPSPAAQALGAALWSVDSGGLTVGGQHFGFDALPDLAAALGTPGHAADVVLVVRPDARVQDLTVVLASLRAANVGSVQVASGER